MMSVLLACLALAEPDALIRGEDLVALQAIEHAELSLSDQTEALRAFILTHSDSPLVTEAWRHLDALDGTSGDWVPVSKTFIVSRIARRSRAEDKEAQRTWLATSVSQLGPEGVAWVIPKPRWLARVDCALGWDGSPYTAFGLGVGRGAWSGVARLGRQQATYVEIAGRLRGPLSFGPWVEVHIDTMARPGISGGGEVLLGPTWALEARVGWLLHEAQVLPRVSGSVVYRIPVSPPR